MPIDPVLAELRQLSRRLQRLEELNAPADALLASGSIPLTPGTSEHISIPKKELILFFQIRNKDVTDAGNAGNLYYWFASSPNPPMNQKFTLVAGDTRSYTTQISALTVQADPGATASAAGVEFEFWGNGELLNKLEARRVA